jgi:hypothetical protein
LLRLAADQTSGARRKIILGKRLRACLNQYRYC